MQQPAKLLDSFRHDAGLKRPAANTPKLGVAAKATCISFGVKSRYLVVGDDCGAVCLWDIKKRARVRHYFHPNEKACFPPSYSGSDRLQCTLSIRNGTPYISSSRSNSCCQHFRKRISSNDSIPPRPCNQLMWPLEHALAVWTCTTWLYNRKYSPCHLIQVPLQLSSIRQSINYCWRRHLPTQASAFPIPPVEMWYSACR